MISKGVILCSGLCFLGLSAAVAFYKREALLSVRESWVTSNQEDPTKTDHTQQPNTPNTQEADVPKETPQSDSHQTPDVESADETTSTSTRKSDDLGSSTVSDSDSFFSVKSEIDGDDCILADLSDSSSSVDCRGATKRSIVIKGDSRGQETDDGPFFAEAMRMLTEQLSSPIVATVEFHTPQESIDARPPRRLLNDHVHVYHDAIPTCGTPQATSYNRIYDGYRAIVSPTPFVQD